MVDIANPTVLGVFTLMGLFYSYVTAALLQTGDGGDDNQDRTINFFDKIGSKIKSVMVAIFQSLWVSKLPISEKESNVNPAIYNRYQKTRIIVTCVSLGIILLITATTYVQGSEISAFTWVILWGILIVCVGYPSLQLAYHAWKAYQFSKSPAGIALKEEAAAQALKKQ